MTPFFFNQFLAAAAKKLPYTPLQYLESTGTQYINTGVAPDFAGGDEIRLSFYAPSGTGAVVTWGSRASGVRNGIYNTGDGAIVVADATSFGYLNSTSPNANNMVTVNDSNVTINGNSATMSKRVTVAQPLYLFTLNNVGSAFGIFSGVKFYEFSYYSGGAVAQHLVPALDANGVPCMWDTVSNTAKYNAGTGTFNYA